MATLCVVDRDGNSKTIEAGDGTTVMEVIRNAGIDELLALCGGCCSCATCHVYVDASSGIELPPIGEDEDDLLDGSEHRTAASRLACQIPFGATVDGLTVTIAPEN